MGTEGSKHRLADTEDNKLGLENLGNTCYCNAVLQALFWCEPFRNSVINYCEGLATECARIRHSGSGPGGAAAAEAAAGGGPASPVARLPMVGEVDAVYENSLLASLHNIFLQLLNPARLKRASSKHVRKLVKGLRTKMFLPYQQQDAHEMLTNLLSDVCDTVRAIDKIRVKYGGGGAAPNGVDGGAEPAKTFVESVFEGHFAAETKCMTCEERTSRKESFLSISVDIDQNMSLYRALKRFGEGELLNSDNKFYCDSCRSLQEAKRSLQPQHPPPVLCIHLKRFKYLEESGHVKLSYRVHTPHTLRLPVEGPAGDAMYTLFAVVVHKGCGPNMGHYECNTLCRGQWANFDDELVTPLSEASLSQLYGVESNTTLVEVCVAFVLGARILSFLVCIFNARNTQASSTGYILFYALPGAAVPLVHV